MKIIVYGSTNNKTYTPEQIEKCERLGKFLGENGVGILTGSSRGYPYYVGRAAIAAGGSVTGFSPAINLEDHVKIFEFPTDGVTDLVFNKIKYETMPEAFLHRQIEQLAFAKTVIALGGSWGTFSEIVLSFLSTHTIILVEEFEGAVKAFQDVYNFFGERCIKPEVHHGAKIITVKTVDEAIQEVAELNT